jgi:PadR family transcriptional regulator AphA
MSARHALLGLLVDGPGHGYELGKRLREKLGPAWEINSGQLSKTISKLEEEGLVRAVDDMAMLGDRKRVVALTDAGAVELDRWFGRDTPGVRVSRPEFLAKVNLGGPDRCEASLGHIAAYEADCVARLEELRDGRDRVALWPVLMADRVLKRCAISFEMMEVEAHLHGARLTRETVAWLKDSGALWGSSVAHTDAETVRERERAREQIFRRMAKSHLDALPGDENPAT